MDALYLTGFSRQSVVSTDAIIAALEALPPHHLEGLREIRYEPGRQTQRILATQPGHCLDPAVEGQFVDVVQAISIYRIHSRPQFFHLLYHEVGHHVFLHVLDSRVRKVWVTELYPNSAHVTAYAGRNAQEDFAETYAAFARRPEAGAAIPRKARFMRERVFGPVRASDEGPDRAY